MTDKKELIFKKEECSPEPVLSFNRFKRVFNRSRERRNTQRLDWFPIAKHFRSMMGKNVGHDARAGLNVALLDFPQGMAYALIAGLPFSMGIYASAVAAFVGPFFASSRFIMLGPTNAIAVLTLSSFIGLGFTQEQAVAAMPLLLIMIGLFMILGALIGAAGVIRFVSRTVITGYITAAAFLIIVKQLRHVLGVTTEKSATFADSLISVIHHLPESHWESICIAAVTIVLYLLLKKFVKGIPHVAVVLIVMYFVAQYLRTQGWEITPLSEKALSAGHWPITLPTFSFELMGKLAAPAMALAFLSLLESSSIAKTLAARAGDSVNINQQMLSMGVANSACAFLGGMPISGSLTRSALNYSSGARTPLSSMISASLLAGGILVLAPYMANIPMPSLSALVILVGISLFNRKNIRVALGATVSDAAVFLITFTSGLMFPLDTAIYFGVGASLFLFLRKAAAPHLTQFRLMETGEEVRQATGKPALALLHMDGNFFFGSSDLFLDEVRELLADRDLRIIILRIRNAYNIDASAAVALEQVARLMKEKGQHLLISSVQPEAEWVLRNSGLLEEIGPENIFREDPDNPTLSTSLALKRARELVDEQLEVRLFVRNKKEDADASTGHQSGNS